MFQRRELIFHSLSVSARSRELPNQSTKFDFAIERNINKTLPITSRVRRARTRRTTARLECWKKYRQKYVFPLRRAAIRKFEENENRIWITSNSAEIVFKASQSHFPVISFRIDFCRTLFVFGIVDGIFFVHKKKAHKASKHFPCCRTFVRFSICSK